MLRANEVNNPVASSVGVAKMLTEHDTHLQMFHRGDKVTVKFSPPTPNGTAKQITAHEALSTGLINVVAPSH